MKKLPKLFDRYSRIARLLPALLTLFPEFVAIACLFPETYKSVASTIGSLAASCGVLLLLATGVRHLGRKTEQQLCDEWGGMPTTIWLRHRDSSLDETTKKRYYDFLEKHVSGLVLPTPDDEKRNPAEADGRYRSATKWLLEYTRDKSRFALVFEELINYGFQRNTLGVKPIAVPLLVLEIAVLAGYGYAKFGSDISQITGPFILSATVSVVALSLWLVVVTAKWVKDAGDAYARAILAACDISPPAKGRKNPSKR